MNKIIISIAFLIFIFPKSLTSQELVDLFVINTKAENRKGPFVTSETAPYPQVNLYFQAIQSTTLEKGAFCLNYNFTMGNFFHEEMVTADRKYTVYTDVETYIHSLDFSYGILKWLTIGIEFRFVHHLGGGMDPYIQAFHRTFRSPNGGREYYRDNQIRVFIKDNDTDKYLININKAAFGLGDTTLKTNFSIFQTANKEFGIGAVLAIKFPTGDAETLRGSGNFDFGGGIGFDIAIFRWWIFYINGFYSFNGNYKGANDVTFKLANRWQLTFASEWRVSEKSSLILQYTTFNSAWENLRLFRISGIGIQIFLGFKYEISKNFTFQFFIMEELEPWVTSDISFNFGFHFKL